MTPPFDQNNPEGQRENAASTTQDFKSTATEASSKIKQQATQALNENRSNTADEIESVAQAARVAASELQDQDHAGLSQYVTQVADSISSLANGLREKNIDDLIRGAEKIARENPALFIAGSVAIGLGIARFAKASSQRTDTQPSADSEFSAATHAPLASDDYTEEDWLGRNSLRNSDRSDPFDDATANQNTANNNLAGGNGSGAGGVDGLSRSNGNGANITGGTRYE